MSKGRIPKIKQLAPHLAHIAKSVNPIVEIVNRGLVVDSETVVAKRLADGRIVLYLHPRIASQFE